MNLLAFVVAAWLIGLLTGATTTPLFQKLSRMGKRFFVIVNPRTKQIETRWARTKGEVGDFKFSDDTPKSVALDGPLAHNCKGRTAFLVNSQAGVAFNVETEEPFKAEVVMDASGAPVLDALGKEKVVRVHRVDGKDVVEDTRGAVEVVKGMIGKNRTPHLNGSRLNAIRKDTRVQQIAASNRTDMALIAKLVLFGMVFLGLMGIASLWMLSQLTKHAT